MEKQNFVDYVKILFRSGKGGAGSVHFHRDKKTAKGGPDGGDGGRGGHIILKGNSQLWTLLHLKYQKHTFAGNGQNGAGVLRTGKQGEDKIIEVPLGTVAKNAETGEVLAEILDHDQEIILFAGEEADWEIIILKRQRNKRPAMHSPVNPDRKYGQSWN